MEIHAEIRICGIVQGVGFRPFVHKAAEQFALRGFVRNTSYGADITVEGEAGAVDAFVSSLEVSAPRLAYIESVDVKKSRSLDGLPSFGIAESEGGSEKRTLVSPDVAICDDCLRELYDKADRRYRYPFINCTNCGPRFTIIRDIPYDRKNTTMASFPMCESCAAEYGDIRDRRYHAQPDCCEVCGPELLFFGADGEPVAGEAVALAREYIRAGKIVAVKGLGGIHLACRCDDAETVMTLRVRKRRDEKPFAIMCRDVAEAEKYAEISAEEERLLTSHRRPIVLLKKRERSAFAHLSENGYIGIMLPYTPVHYLLLEDRISSVVMTSANISDLPIIYKDIEARKSLSGIADGFLLNNREIHTRCDDSLMWVYRGHEYFARRSRGYVPYPLSMKKEMPPVLACGAEQKASFALSRGHHVFPGQHIGDLKNIETLDSFEAQIAHFENIFDIKPVSLVCDLHPDYMSTSYAEERAQRENIPLYRVQHHHAHMASCMADNGYEGKCIGIVWDGTGYGTDGKIRGAEFLVGDFSDFSRCGTIRPITLPGGDRTTKEISRVAAALLDAAALPCDESISKILRAGINCPEVTSMGRLFDGISALLGICSRASYEGQGAVLLEAAAEDNVDKVYPYSINKNDGIYVFDWREMIRCIEADKANGVHVGKMSAAFMNTLVSFAARMCAKISQDTGIKTVALSGGTFQNMYILKRLDERLCELGFQVLTHRRVSCNDEGISLGQVMIAQSAIRNEKLNNRAGRGGSARPAADD